MVTLAARAYCLWLSPIRRGALQPALRALEHQSINQSIHALSYWQSVKQGHNQSHCQLSITPSISHKINQSINQTARQSKCLRPQRRTELNIGIRHSTIQNTIPAIRTIHIEGEALLDNSPCTAEFPLILGVVLCIFRLL